MANFSNDGMVVHCVGDASATNIGGVTNFGNNPNTTTTAPETGDAYPQAQALISQTHEGSVTTTSLKSVLDTIGLTGKCIRSDGSHAGAQMFAQKHDSCSASGRAASGHISKTYNNGHLLIDSINGSGRSAVESQLMAHGISSDGVTRPYDTSTSATLPATIDLQQFVIGKPTILGTVINYVESVNVSYNTEIEKTDDAGSIWPTDYSIVKVSPVVELTVRSPELYGTTFPEGGQRTNSDTVLRYIQRVLEQADEANSENSAFKQFDANHHILGQLNGLVTVTQDYSAAGQAFSRCQIRIDCSETTSVVPIVWTTDVHYDLTEVTPQTT